MPEPADELPILDNDAKSQYEVHLEGQTAVLQYLHRGDRVVLVHTGVPGELEGRGIAGQLAKHALQAARANGLKVVPRCPYVRAYIDRHPEFADLVVEQ